MPIDPSISLKLQQAQPIDLFGNFEKALQLRGLVDQQQEVKFQREYKLNELYLKQKLRTMYADADPGPAGDEERLRIEAQFGNPETSLNMRGKLREQHNELRAQFGHALAMIPSEDRAKAWTAGLPGLAAQGVDIGNMPQEFPGNNAIVDMLARSKNYFPAANIATDKFAHEAARKKALQQQANLQAAAPGVEIKPMATDQMIPMGQNAQTTMPPVVVQDNFQEGNSLENRMRVASALEESGQWQEAEKYRIGVDRALKATEEKKNPDAWSRIVTTLRSQPNMPPMEQRAMLDALGHQTGIPDDFQYELQDGGLRLVARADVQASKTTRAKLSGTNISMNSYEKTLGKLDAESVGKARQSSDDAYNSLDQIDTIVQVLKGHKGGPLDAFRADWGQYLPGTGWNKLTTANQIAEGIRAKLAPMGRVAGSGSTSDFEMKMYLSALPSLMTTEDGRIMMAKVARRIADRAAFSAETKDEMVRNETYSPRKLREAMLKNYGDKLLGTNEIDAMKNGTLSSKGAAPQEQNAPSYRGRWRK